MFDHEVDRYLSSACLLLAELPYWGGEADKHGKTNL